MTEKAKRVFAYVDGYNLFHYCYRTIQNSSGMYKKEAMWYDVNKIVREYINNGQDKEINTRFYTARPTEKTSYSVERFNIYTKALEAVGVEIIRGKFQIVPQTLNPKKQELRIDEYKKLHFSDKTSASYNTTKEKETDVHIAVDIVSHALIDEYEKKCEYDQIVLISGDSDFHPAVQCVLDNTDKHVLILILPNDKAEDSANNKTKYFKQYPDSFTSYPLTMEVMERCRLDASLPDYLKG